MRRVRTFGKELRGNCRYFAFSTKNESVVARYVLWIL